MASQELTEAYVETALATYFEFPEVFFGDQVYIKTPFGKRLFKLRDYQLEMLDVFRTKRYTIVLKARQLGFTTLISAYALWLSLFHDDQVVDIFANKELNAKRILGRVKYAYDNLPTWVKESLPKPTKRNETKWEFDNGSSIEAFTATKDSGRGETANLAILDEWASYRSTTSGEDMAERAWASIEPTIDIGGKFIGGSTAQGIENYFHTKWESAKDNQEWARLFFPYWVVPGRDADWWARKEAQYMREGTPWILHQEYPRTPEEAFIKSGQNVFNVEILAAIEPRMRGPSFRGRLDDQLYLHSDPHGPLKVFKPPVMGADYAIGADVAEGLERGDFSDATVYLATNYYIGGKLAGRRGEVVARWRGRIDANEFGDVLNALGRYYRTALLGVESNNHGISTLSRLRDLNYPRLYVTEILDAKTRKQTEKLGWLTSRRTKPLIIDGLARALNTGELIFYDEDLRKEMMTFVRRPDGRLGKPSVHDDAVMSAAIGWEMLAHVYEPRYLKRDEPPEGSFGYYNREINKMMQGAQKWM